MLEVAVGVGRQDDPQARELIGEARMLDLVGQQLNRRVGQAMTTGRHVGPGRSHRKTLHGRSRRPQGDDRFRNCRPRRGGVGRLRRFGGRVRAQFSHEAGRIYLAVAPTEMARNVISERVLGMPRERSYDPSLPFRRRAPGRADPVGLTFRPGAVVGSGTLGYIDVDIESERLVGDENGDRWRLEPALAGASG